MSLLKNLIVLAALGTSSVAMAAPSHISDTQYLQLNRCRALMASPELGGGDTRAIDVALKTEGRGRINYIYDRGQQVQTDAARAAHRAGGDSRARLIAERDGTCQALVGSVTTAAAPAKGNTSN